MRKIMDTIRAFGEGVDAQSIMERRPRGAGRSALVRTRAVDDAPAQQWPNATAPHHFYEPCDNYSSRSDTDSSDSSCSSSLSDLSSSCD